MTDILFSDYYTTTTGIWYLSTTILEHRMCLNRFIETQLRLFRWYFYSKNFNTSGRRAICNVCQNHFVPTLYLIECPGLNIRQNSAQELLPVHNSLPAEEKAKYII